MTRNLTHFKTYGLKNSPTGLIISSVMTEPNSPKIIEVAVPLPLDTTFHYAVPPALAPLAVTGVRVLVPFGRRKLTGYVIGAVAKSDEEVKEIIAVLDPEPLFTAAELEFLRWTAGYYLHPLGEVIKAALPAGINITSSKKKLTAPDGTETAEEALRGGKRVKTELFYRAAEPQPEGTLRDKPARIVAFLACTGRSAGAAAAPGVRGRWGAPEEAHGKRLRCRNGAGGLPRPVPGRGVSARHPADAQ